MNRLSIIIPTVGRASLAATLASIAEQWDGEQVLVLSHTGQDAAVEIFRDADPCVTVDGRPAWTIVTLPDHGHNFYGHDLRNYALTSGLVVGSHVATIDDDDVYLDGALEAMGEAVVAGAPVTVFKARWGAGHPASGVVLWHQPHVAKGNIATPMIVARRGAARWGAHYFGDYDYAAQLLEIHPADSWVWDERIIAEVRPA